MSTCSAFTPGPKSITRDRSSWLKILHVIETLRYDAANRVIRVYFDVIVKNDTEDLQDLYIIHRSDVSASLDRFFAPSEKNPEKQKIRELLKDLYCPQIGKENSAFEFAPRIGGITFADDKGHVTAVQSGDGQLRSLEEPGSFPLDAENLKNDPACNVSVPFSRFAIAGFSPKKCTAFRVELLISNDSYDLFIGDPSLFFVDGTNVVLSDIEHVDLFDHDESSEYRKVYEQEIKENEIIPTAYDVVIPRDASLSSPVNIHTDSSSRIVSYFNCLKFNDERQRLVDSVHWYAGQSPEFSLRLSYASSVLEKLEQGLSLIR